MNFVFNGHNGDGISENYHSLFKNVRGSKLEQPLNVSNVDKKKQVQVVFVVLFNDVYVNNVDHHSAIYY